MLQEYTIFLYLKELILAHLLPKLINDKFNPDKLISKIVMSLNTLNV